VLVFSLNGKYSNFADVNANTTAFSPLPVRQFKALPESIQNLLISYRVPISTSGSVKRHINQDAASNTAPPNVVAFRWDWGDGHGDFVSQLRLDDFGITSASLATVSVSECEPGGPSQGTHLSAAYLTVFNVAVKNNFVCARFHADWSVDLRLCLDYFIVVDPTPYVIGDS
jgi:hypothetical protein